MKSVVLALGVGLDDDALIVNVRAVERDQQWLMPSSLSEWLPCDHLAWFVLDVVAERDLAGFYGSLRQWLMVPGYDSRASAARVADSALERNDRSARWRRRASSTIRTQRRAWSKSARPPSEERYEQYERHRGPSE